MLANILRSRSLISINLDLRCQKEWFFMTDHTWFQLKCMKKQKCCWGNLSELSWRTHGPKWPTFVNIRNFLNHHVKTVESLLPLMKFWMNKSRKNKTFWTFDVCKCFEPSFTIKLNSSIRKKRSGIQRNSEGKSHLSFCTYTAVIHWIFPIHSHCKKIIEPVQCSIQKRKNAVLRVMIKLYLRCITFMMIPLV